MLHPTSETVRVQDAAVLSYTGKHFFHTYSSTDCIVESVTEVSLQLACRKEKIKKTDGLALKKYCTAKIHLHVDPRNGGRTQPQKIMSPKKNDLKK